MQRIDMEDDATRQLVAALLAQPEVRIRRRWSALQLTLWCEQGWCEPCGSALFRVTDAVRRALQTQWQEWELQRRPDEENRLQRLGIQLPEQAPATVLGALLHGDRRHVWHADEWQQLQEQGITPLDEAQIRLRSAVGFSLFFPDGGMLDLQEPLRLLGECLLTASVVARLTKFLWHSQPPQRVITTTSHASFLLYPLAEHELLLWLPTKAYALLPALLAAMPGAPAWWHLGDLHPQALQQAVALALSVGRPLQPILPANLDEYLAAYGKPLDAASQWRVEGLSRELQIRLAPALMAQRWLEQEAFILAPAWQP